MHRATSQQLQRWLQQINKPGGQHSLQLLAIWQLGGEDVLPCACLHIDLCDGERLGGAGILRGGGEPGRPQPVAQACRQVSHLDRDLKVGHDIHLSQGSPFWELELCCRT